MVGYTALLQIDERLGIEKRQRYIDAVERHHESHGGTVVQRLGDGTMSMFPSALGAVEAAVAIQQELAAVAVPVRIGIHVGEVIVEAERLTGDAVNIAARIESFAVPGGVMLSDAAYAQIRNRTEIAVVPLGSVRLKNVGQPVELYGIDAEGLVLPDPAALEGKGERLAVLPSNLPASATPLIARSDDLATLAGLARETRLVTITGPGGVGKTRTLVELGRLLTPEFLDGVAFAPFADVVEGESFVPALAEALDVKESQERTLAAGITTLVSDRNVLLLLDNLEQIVEAAADAVARLIASCPQLHVVATSRTPLRIAAEREYPLPPLELGPSVELFAARAPAALTPRNERAVEAICRRLDGLPLAVELAAARLRILSPEALLERLDHTLDVLQSGARDAPSRQQTLRATIEWSHSLLDDVEQRLFRRLAVFAGGCTLADVEAVCADDGASCLDELESLVEKALVQADGAGRLRMLQTIGEYARERLEAAGEAELVARRHAYRYAAVARQIRDGIEGPTQLASTEWGITEDTNLTAALDTFLASARSGDAQLREAGLQMTGDLWMYWHIRGKNVSAQDYAEAFLATDPGRTRTMGRSAALITVGLALWIVGDFKRSNATCAEAYEIAEELGASRELCLASFMRGLALLVLDGEAAKAWGRTGVEHSRAYEFVWAQGFSLTLEALACSILGETDSAQALFTEALVIQEELQDQEGLGMSYGGLAQLAAGGGAADEALELYRRSLTAFETVGDRAEEARILSEIAWTVLAAGDTELARRYFFDAVQAHTDVASVRGVGVSLIGLAAAEQVDGRPDRAAQIAAAAEVYAQGEGIVVVYSDETPGEELVGRARAALAPDELERATEGGRRMTIDEVLALTRQSAPGAPAAAP